MAHADVFEYSWIGGGTINRAGQLGLLTDAGVAAADTLAGLTSFVNNVVVHADQQQYKGRIPVAWQGNAAITDATVLGLTTVAGLAALTATGSNTTTINLYD